VLVDSERIAVRIEARALAELGWEVSEAEVAERFVGGTSAMMIAAIEEHTGRPAPADWEERAEARYREAFAAELGPVDGVVEAIDAIDAPVCVASNGSHDKMRFTLGLAGLYERFAGRIFSADDVGRGKPAPDLFLHAAGACGAEPARCAVVEDSRHGVEAARAAGMRAYGYAGGVTPRERLEGPGTVVFDDMRELPRLLSCT
jgi:HAD superfamily hydrolase (TIGR01509 family)